MLVEAAIQNEGTTSKPEDMDAMAGLFSIRSKAIAAGAVKTNTETAVRKPRQTVRNVPAATVPAEPDVAELIHK
jgi:enoyl-[acyl-carrier-protein] reductase (NADH)